MFLEINNVKFFFIYNLSIKYCFANLTSNNINKAFDGTIILHNKGVLYYCMTFLWRNMLFFKRKITKVLSKW